MIFALLLGSGKDLWILASGASSERFVSSLGKRAEHIRTWDIHPTSVTLYRWVQEEPSAIPGNAERAPGGQ